MNMNRASELDAYWIAERYHGSHDMNEFVNCLHEYNVPRDDGILIWHIIDAAVDIAPQINKISVPCKFFSRDKVCTGKAADGGNMYQSVPWCNHVPSQLAVP